MAEEILEKIKELREKAKKRGFTQTFDLIVNLREIDLKNPENKINEDLELPFGTGREINIVVFSDTFKAIEGARVIGSKEIVEMVKNKRRVRKLVKSTDFFLAEPKLMPIVGKHLGVFLAPRGKMPKLISGNLDKLVKRYKQCVKIRLKDSPVIQCPVGKENMKNEAIAENIKSVLSFLEEKLPRGKANLKEVLIKLSMSKPLRIEV